MSVKMAVTTDFPVIDTDSIFDEWKLNPNSNIIFIDEEKELYILVKYPPFYALTNLSKSHEEDCNSWYYLRDIREKIKELGNKKNIDLYLLTDGLKDLHTFLDKIYKK
jgi:hypothetical protein